MTISCKRFYKLAHTSGTFWRLAALASAGIVLIIISIYTGQEGATLNRKDNIFSRLASTLILAALVWAIGKWMWDVHKSHTKPRWWDVGSKQGHPDWEDVRRMAMGATPDDPVQYVRINLRVGFFFATFCLIASYLVLGCTTIVGLISIAENRVPPPSSMLVTIKGFFNGLNADLTAFLALIAAATSIYFTFRQLRAKVKADSRQAWIDKLRSRISRTIAFADAVRYRRNNKDIDNIRKELIDARLEMELMLNPSEKDHRLLMYLIQKLAFFGKDIESDMDDGFEKIEDVINIRRSIRKCHKHDEGRWKSILTPIPDITDTDRSKVYSDLVGYTIRLAHIVLKREWEHVKATR